MSWKCVRIPKPYAFHRALEDFPSILLISTPQPFDLLTSEVLPLLFLHQYFGLKWISTNSVIWTHKRKHHKVIVLIGIVVQIQWKKHHLSHNAYLWISDLIYLMDSTLTGDDSIYPEGGLCSDDDDIRGSFLHPTGAWSQNRRNNLIR